MIADDEHLPRAALSVLLTADDRSPRPLAAVRRHHPDVLPLDLQMDGLDNLGSGGAVPDPRITARLLPRLRVAGGQLNQRAALDTLSARERQVLTLLADGRPNADTATRLGLTEATIKS